MGLGSLCSAVLDVNLVKSHTFLELHSSMNEERFWTRNILSVFELGCFLGFVTVLLWEALHRNEHLFIISSIR